ncbi:MAG: agmatinase [Parcubacteria group bacterium]|jgi:agmatinase
MKKLYETWPHNFGAIENQDFQKSKIVIIPVSYDATSSYKSGTKEGGEEIISASCFLDEIEPDETGVNLLDFKATDIYTLDKVIPTCNSAEEAIEGVEQAIENEILKYKKIPLMLGGEHSITLGAVRALKKNYKDLSVLHFDAHTDLMDQWEGSKFSHACVIRRIREEKIKTVSIGIRNFNPEVRDYIKKERPAIFPAPGLPPVEKARKNLTKNVYLTFDVDAFDPSIMPSTGTPEPGGLYWHETINFIEKISKQVNIVGADVVELMPIPGLHAPNFMAAKLVYNIIKNIL